MSTAGRFARRSHTSKAGNGFTLVELLIAITILSLILTVAYSAIGNILRTSKVLEDERDGRQVMDAVLVRMTREIQLASGGDALLPPRDDLSHPYGPRVFLLGEQSDLDTSRRGDRITFMAREGGQYLPDGAGHSGVVQISYRVQRDPEDSRRDAPYYLVREEVPYRRPYQTAYESSMIFPVTDRIVSLEFSYYNPKTSEWVATWGTGDSIGLPSIVRLTVAVASPLGKIETATTAVPIRSRD